MTSFQEVVSSNRALLARARELNTRAGTNLFPVQDRDELMKLFAVALAGARRVAEVSNVSALILPALDDRLVEKVLREQPDTITIIGREATVEYRGGGYNPRVRIDFRGDESRKWLKLPDTGIHLPGGREVSMYSSLEGYGYYVEANSSQFKTKARECLNQGLWDNWQKPELPAPTDFVSPIVEAEYGRCVVTNVSLIAFGAVNHDSWYGSWKSYWSRDRAEVESVHVQVCAKFTEVKEKVAHDALKKRVGELYGAHSYNRELPEEIRTRLYKTCNGYSDGARTVAEITAFIAEVEAEVEATSKRQVEAKRKEREAEARREAVSIAINEIGVAVAHIWVPENSDVAYILAGKTSKMGNFDVTPVVNDPVLDSRPYCFGDSKYRRWVPFRLGVRSRACDYSGRGNLQSEVQFFVPKGLLAAGVYAVAQDGEGQFFFPVIHHNAEGVEVIPEISAIRKIRVSKEDLSSPLSTKARVSNDALEALRARFK